MGSRPHIVSIVCVLFWMMALSVSSHAEEDQFMDGVGRAHHSYIPIVFYKDGFYPIVGVENKMPLINVKGRLVPIKEDTRVFFSASGSDVSPRIKAGRLISNYESDVESQFTSDGQSEMGWGLGGFTRSIAVEDSRNNNGRTKTKDMLTLREEITPISGSLRNAYGVFIFYSERGVAELHWINLKDIPEGEKLSVKIPYTSKEALKKHKNPRYLFLTFQDGEELVPVDHFQRENLLKWLEALSMAQISSSYAKVTPEDEAEPSLAFGLKFNLSQSDYQELEGKVIPVTVVINQMGIISDVTIDVNIPRSIANEIANTVRLWKFFPAKREGKLVTQEVIIPLQF